ncbi:hypothetical protein [Sinorhizobium fredii]|uniref:hypothetical protein n=1 Tax=Rhizobium fredii TaxID=380 RepID=UPI001297DE8B|nr:hypothetical protein [Sinorhizobium fredii]MQW94029.1 hypothetical protein [Sinorhizobium fredii]
MLTLEQFESLEVGDQIETVAVFPKLSHEPVVLRTVEKTKDGNRIDFVVTYFGVTLGRWVCSREQEALKWQV